MHRWRYNYLLCFLFAFVCLVLFMFLYFFSYIYYFCLFFLVFYAEVQSHSRQASFWWSDGLKCQQCRHANGIKLHLLVVLCILVEVHAVEWGERTYARETVCQLPLQHKVFCVFNEFAGRNLHTYNIQTFKHTYILYIHIYKHICMYVSSIWFLTTRKHLHICNETASSCVAPHLTKSKDIK